MTRPAGRASGRRVAVVTGGVSGLGLALAKRLGADAWRVVLADVAVDRGPSACRAVEEAGGVATFVALDARDAAAVEALADVVFERWGRCDLLVNNAGVAAAGAIADVPLDTWRWCVDINLMGPIHGCHSFAPRMRRQGHGHIINIASLAAFARVPLMSPYNATKLGVVALSEALSAELAPAGVGVTVVCPGFFTSGLHATMRGHSAGVSERARRLIDRSGTTAEQVAARVLAAAARGDLYVFPTHGARFMAAARRLFPSMLERVLVVAAARLGAGQP